MLSNDKLFPIKPRLLRVFRRSLKSTMGKGEIAHNDQSLLFYPFGKRCTYLTHYQMTNFRLLQIERIRRRQSEI